MAELPLTPVEASNLYSNLRATHDEILRLHRTEPVYLIAIVMGLLLLPQLHVMLAQIAAIVGIGVFLYGLRCNHKAEARAERTFGVLAGMKAANESLSIGEKYIASPTRDMQ